MHTRNCRQRFLELPVHVEAAVWIAGVDVGLSVAVNVFYSGEIAVVGDHRRVEPISGSGLSQFGIPPLSPPTLKQIRRRQTNCLYNRRASVLYESFYGLRSVV